MTELWEAKKWLKRASAETTVGGELGSTIVLEASVAGRSRPRFVKKRAKTHKPTLSWPSRPKQP
jgi:hypothetical protein